MHFAFISDTLDSIRSGLPAGRNTQPAKAFEPRPAGTKKILLLSVSAGAGHIRAAEAIRTYANMHLPDINAVHVDVMDFVPAAFRKIYSNFYITLVTRFPGLWGLLYRAMNSCTQGSVTEKTRQCIQRMSATRLLDEIARLDPDVIICTHFLPAEILAPLARKNALRCQVWVQVTDFDLHRIWVHDGMAGYFAANEEVAFRMRTQGVPPQSIHVAGIPVVPAFAHILDRAQCARELGIDPQRMTFLLMGGGAGVGKLDELAAKLLAMNLDFQLVVLAGKNETLLDALKNLSRRFPGRLIPQGFTTRIERLMACADVAITKPGGLTTAECLAIGLPMIIHSPIPGQEERNADFLLEQGVALKATDAEMLEFRIRFLLESPAKLADMRTKAKALGRPFAARNVIDTALRNS